MHRHGVYVQEKATSVSVPTVAPVGIPFIIGAAPVQSAESPVPAGEITLCTSWNEAIEKLGFSEDFSKYNLCEFMYSHFVLYGQQPAIFCNLLDIGGMASAVPATDKPVEDHKGMLPLEAIDDSSLVVQEAGGGSSYVKDTDYGVYYSGENLVIELLEPGTAYEEKELNVGYKAVKPSSVTHQLVATGLQNIEKCLTSTGIVPDLICAPGYSDNPMVAAVMATKAAGVNGLFKAKALVDISSKTGGAMTYTDAIVFKGKNNLVDEDMIVCWPMLKLGGYQFHMSTQLAGLMAKVDGDNGGVPYESPSNKAFKCDSIVLASGKEISLTHEQANILDAQGIITSLRFMGALTCWGNYTGCYPMNSDVKDMLIPISRMFGWVGSTLIKTFWGKLGKPMNSRLLHSIKDTCNIWLNGIVGSDYLLGARVEVFDEENPLTDLMAGIIRVHIYITPPSSLKEVNFILEYDAGYVASAFAG